MRSAKRICFNEVRQKDSLLLRSAKRIPYYSSPPKRFFTIQVRQKNTSGSTNGSTNGGTSGSTSGSTNGSTNGRQRATLIRDGPGRAGGAVLARKLSRTPYR